MRTISQILQPLDQVTLGNTSILPRIEIEAMVNEAYRNGRDWAERNPIPTVMTFEGKPLDPDKLATLLTDLKCLSAIHERGTFYDVDWLVSTFDSLFVAR